MARLDRTSAEKRFAPVYETLARVVPELPDGVPVIGFCGAPWTVATYMVEGGGSKDQAEARLWAYRDPASFQSLIDLLVETSIAYLLGQVKAGAGVLQIFDSWAGSLPNDEFARWCSHPTSAIVAGVKAVYPDVPIIGFPRGCGASAERYAQETEVDAIGCDTSMSLAYMCETLAEPAAGAGQSRSAVACRRRRASRAPREGNSRSAEWRARSCSISATASFPTRRQSMSRGLSSW